MDELRAEGLSEHLLDALETPAGLDIGARTPGEVALSIVARIVEVRRGRTRGGNTPEAAAGEPGCCDR